MSVKREQPGVLKNSNTSVYWSDLTNLNIKHKDSCVRNSTKSLKIKLIILMISDKVNVHIYVLLFSKKSTEQ